jgi:parallel beta-helix repeat protein
MHEADRIVIRDMTVNAGGPFRASSDAIDFDGGNGVVIERVKIARSRSRGIVLDGKDFSTADEPRTADRNRIRDCVVIGIPDDGIELLAARNNHIEGCTITNVGGRGIQVTKSGPDPIGQGGAKVQINKKSNDNVLIGNIIDRAGYDGIEILSSDRNVIDANTVTNSSDEVRSRDGIRIDSADSQSCNDNVVRNNRATDTRPQEAKTQTFGLRIADSLCQGTVVGPNNDFTGNRVGEIYPPP